MAICVGIIMVSLLLLLDFTTINTNGYHLKGMMHSVGKYNSAFRHVVDEPKLRFCLASMLLKKILLLRDTF